MAALIPYFGGKSRLAKTIISKFPEHQCYVEVFAGGAHVLFNKPQSKIEVINDLDRDLVSLYRTVKYHPEELHRQFKYVLIARDEFQRLMQVNPDTLTDIQRAARYLYLQRMCFGGRVHNRTFGTSTTSAPRLNLFTLQRLIEDAWIRLSQVMIECLDFRELIPRYDREHTLFFVDPPYWGIDGYEHNFVERDFYELADALGDIKGRFLLTINDTPEVREIFKRFWIEEVQLTYSMSRQVGSRAKVRTELLIGN
ncbi:DNA adenine methylase [Desulfobulbus sp.]|uniref:DNA adenine methylase n=1 Tax=Desulfobulbus sp. TaxID=895 RepID=UPI00286F12C0|nr:DNA adenine methylase [Desulfobulbus sp.]